MIHVDFMEDSNGDTIDVVYYCSADCFAADTGQDSSGHAWPGGSETDYDVYCENCRQLLWKGLSSDA